MKEYKHQCIIKVFPSEPFGFGHGHRCLRDGSVEREGQWYCKTHDPITIEEKRRAIAKKFNDRLDREAAIVRRAHASSKACEGIPTKALEEGVIQEMINSFKALKDDATWLKPEAIRQCATAILAKLADKES